MSWPKSRPGGIRGITRHGAGHFAHLRTAAKPTSPHHPAQHQARRERKKKK